MITKGVVLITGVSREMGLGYETARQMKDLGFTIIITAREIEKVKELAAKIDVHYSQLDVTKEDSIQKLFTEIENDYGKLDVLINNAGSYFDQGAEPLDTDMQFVMDAFDLNLMGA